MKVDIMKVGANAPTQLSTCWLNFTILVTVRSEYESFVKNPSFPLLYLSNDPTSCQITRIIAFITQLQTPNQEKDFG